MKRLRRKIGDVFVASLNEGKKYFQYLVSDNTQLGGDVIRVFKKKYSADENPELEDVVNGEVDFHTHVFLNVGNKEGAWEKRGNVPFGGQVNVIFRSDSYMGSKEEILGGEFKRTFAEAEERKKSANWCVWRPNEPMQFVGRLEGENTNSESGGVLPPYAVLERMETGRYPGKWGQEQ